MIILISKKILFYKKIISLKVYTRGYVKYIDVKHTLHYDFKKLSASLF